jgi:restriction system protein
MPPKRKADFSRWMGPVLEALRALGGSGKSREVCDRVAESAKHGDATLAETLASGQSRFYNQVHWARQYLVWEGLIDGSTHGVWALTSRGFGTRLSSADGQQIAAKWAKIHSAAKRKEDEHSEGEPGIPENDQFRDDDHRFLLLEILKKVTPQGFESICGRLLRESGFEKVVVSGGPRDGGIDGIGILQVNPFVSFKVLFQCKRYKGQVSRSQVGDFRNAMIGRADKGIIMTTGGFTADARAEADRDGAPPVELVDGEKLVEMFERVGLGLRKKTIHEVDHAFFANFLPIATE